MKKVTALLFSIVMILGFCLPILSACNKESVVLSKYEINATYDESKRCLKGNEKVTFVNNYSEALDEVKFNLFANAYREDAKFSPIFAEELKSAYYDNESYGKIDINKVAVNGEAVEILIEGEDKNILTVKLKETIFPDEKVFIEIDFAVMLAKVNHRLGVAKQAVNLGNFYPILCVYEEGKGFYECNYYKNGDPFYSEVADYEVIMNLDKDFIVAGSGVKKETVNGEIKKVVFSAKTIRDFAIVFSREFKVEEANVDGIKIQYYYYDDDNCANTVDAAVKAITYFGSTFGKMNTKSLAIVQTGFIQGGMEYPGLVMISDRASIDKVEVAVHEIAHQWWYSAVGNNQIEHAWLDEGLAEYSTLMFFEKHTEYNKTRGNIIKTAQTQYREYVDIYKKLVGKPDMSMTRSLSQYKSQMDYVYQTYVRGKLMFEDIREVVKDKKFIKALKIYYNEYSNKIATPDDLIGIFEEITKMNLLHVFEKYLNGVVSF